MEIVTSKIKKIGKVSFPKFIGERAYMIPIKKNKALPAKFSRWQDTVDSMLDGIDVSDTVYMTIDESFVSAGSSQRREGAHIDGNWTVKGYSTWKSIMMWSTGGGRWRTKNLESGGIILASSSNGAKAYEGDFNGLVGDGGDCSHLDLSSAKVSVLNVNTAYIGNVNMIHEATEAKESSNRTFIRLTLPEDYRFAA